jgi:gamma-glutamyltranspeptidase/glutathione hydrolase
MHKNCNNWSRKFPGEPWRAIGQSAAFPSLDVSAENAFITEHPRLLFWSPRHQETTMNDIYDRREVLKLAGGALLGTAAGRPGCAAATDSNHGNNSKGIVVGQSEAAQVGSEVLTAGGNAVDAVVAAALVAGVVAVQQCGIGGYGGHMVIARAGGKKVTAIDFNSAAPAAARGELFPLDDKGAVRGQINVHGWLAAGVPGTLAGLQLALDRHGSLPFDKLVQPAIRFAREGFPVNAGLATALRGAQARLRKDPASAQLLLDHGEPLRQGSTFRNPDLAALLETLAQRGSVDSFYRGDIGKRIAAAFKEHGGLVTAADLAAYRAREVEPLRLDWGHWSIRTAPLTAGGITVLQTLMILKALGWDDRPAGKPETTHAQLEALRLAWWDRLRLLGDPEKVAVPVERLLSTSYTKRLATQVDAAVKSGRAIPSAGDGRTADGTIHLSGADTRGNLVALTLTHGETFGARVTVPGFGLILGHGMSRFDPRPGHPNSPGPGKRPLHNMCPTIVLRDGQPVLALGGTGGRRIPNSVFEVLAQFVGRGATLDHAVAAPRLHTDGSMAVTMEARWPAAEVDYLKKAGYTVQRGPGARIHAVAFDPKTGTIRAASR